MFLLPVAWFVFAPKSHFSICLLGQLLLAAVIDQVPQERDSEAGLSMQEVYYWVLLGVTPIREWRKQEWAGGVELGGSCSSWGDGRGAMKLREPFRNWLNWSKGVRSLYIHLHWILDVGCLQGGKEAWPWTTHLPSAKVNILSILNKLRNKTTGFISGPNITLISGRVQVKRCAFWYINLITLHMRSRQTSHMAAAAPVTSIPFFPEALGYVVLSNYLLYASCLRPFSEIGEV